MTNFITVQREQLYELVWSKPTTKISKEFGISDVGLMKICRKMGIPKPGLGYWAKVANGKKPAKIPLPKGNYPTEHRIYPKPKMAVPAWLEDIKSFEEKPENKVIHNDAAGETHLWIIKARAKLEQAFKKDKGIVHIYGAKMPTMSVSSGTADRALKAVQTLLGALADRDIKVWIHHQQMLVKVQDETIEIGIKERMKRRYFSQAEKDKLKATLAYPWQTPPNFVDEPGGKLQFFFRNQECFYKYDSRSVYDLDSRPVEGRINDVILALYKMSADIKEIREQRRLAAIEQDKQRKLYEEEQRRLAAIQRQMEKFIGWAQSWQEISQLKECLDNLERRARDLPTEHEAHEVLKTARAQLEKRNIFGNDKLWLQNETRPHMHYMRPSFR